MKEIGKLVYLPAPHQTHDAEAFDIAFEGGYKCGVDDTLRDTRHERRTYGLAGLCIGTGFGIGCAVIAQWVLA